MPSRRVCCQIFPVTFAFRFTIGVASANLQKDLNCERKLVNITGKLRARASERAFGLAASAASGTIAGFASLLNRKIIRAGIEQMLNPEEIVIKPLGNPLKNVSEFLGATILGDGSVVPVLDLIPLLQKNASRIKKQRPPVENRKLKTALSVLIVDDSPSVRQINSKIVKNAGWQVTIAKDGLEALEALQAATELPDVILTDVEMPRMDGYELLAALKRQHNLREIPVVILPRARAKQSPQGFRFGRLGYLTKPYAIIFCCKIKTFANLNKSRSR